MAWEATSALRDRGFDVVLYGNAGTFSDGPSVVMDRVGDMEKARLVAEALGISEFRSEPDSTRLVDVTVRLGSSWAAPRREAEEDRESTPWWDIRRLFRRTTTAESGNR